jgi:aminoglycoside phosphotransferase
LSRESLARPPLADLSALTGLALDAGIAVREGPRATVWRHPVADGREVVVKRYADPKAPTATRERAAYAALRGVEGPLPRCLAQGDDLLVLEAVPGEPLPPDPDAMDPVALHRVAQALGTLHARAREAGARLPGPPAVEQQAQALRHAWPQVEAFVEAALGHVPAGFEPSLRRLADAVAAAPVDACTLTLGDMAPSNVLIAAEGVSFVDLEYAGLREPFYDAMFWRAIVPLPLALARALDETYRAALADAGWPFDDAGFAEGLARAAAHRVYGSLSWGLDALFQRDWPVVPGGPGMRSVLLRHLQQLGGVAAPLEAPLAATAGALREALLVRWPG